MEYQRRSGREFPIVDFMNSIFTGDLGDYEKATDLQLDEIHIYEGGRRVTAEIGAKEETDCNDSSDATLSNYTEEG